MQLGALSNDTSLGQTSWRGLRREAAQDFNDLFQALQQSNLGGAQQAYAALQQLGQSAGAASGQSTAGNTSATTTSAAGASGASSSSPLAAAVADWGALGQALQSGNLSSAQSAFGKVEQDLLAMKQARSGHAAHGGLPGLGAQGDSSQVQAQAELVAKVKADIESINKALKSGDNNSAQDLLGQLEQDLQSGSLGRKGSVYQRPMAQAGWQTAMSGYGQTAALATWSGASQLKAAA